MINVPAELPAPAPDVLDLDAVSAISWLEAYAERSNWTAIEHELAARLDPGWLERAPWPTIVGRTAFPDRLRSPAWELLAFAAPAGFDSRAPFAVILRNASDAPVATHALVCDPGRHLIVEAWERGGDHVWFERRYGSASRSTVERLHNPMALTDVEKVQTHQSLDNAAEPLRTFTRLLLDAAAAFG
jgi:hypothetical protein